MDPIGTITQVAFFTACRAVDAFGTALKYFDDAEALTVALEIERLRLQTWGTNSGLADGTLPPPLVMASDALLRQLDAISRLFADADKLRERYGVQASIDGATEADPGAVSGFVARMRRSLRSSGVRLHTAALLLDDNETAAEPAKGSGASRDVIKRVRWVVKDRELLKKLVTSLRDEIDLLNKVLSETQRQKATNDYERIKIVVVGSAIDERSLALIRAVVDRDRDADTLAKLDRKSLSGDEPRTISGPTSPVAMKSLRLADYDIPVDITTLTRFLAPKKSCSGPLYLFERKWFDPWIDHDSKRILFVRVQRLISLLALPKSASFRVPRAVGYVHDPANVCWWLVFHFPDPPSILSTPIPRSRPQLTTLWSLLQPDYKPRPPLEKRFALASDISTTFYQLYTSSWMHKSIRSDNILFPSASYAGSTGDVLASPLVCGFGYSRLETEAQTIDRSRTGGEVSVAMYRHPDYQGEAAQGYRVHYDIYSLGLVLLEIGLWAPLMSLFDPKPPKTLPTGTASPPCLWKDMKRFHSSEARVLMDRVLYTIDKDLPFRMGSTYEAVARWCLKYNDQTIPRDCEDPPNPALDFYNNVVEPLSSLSAAHAGKGV